MIAWMYGPEDGSTPSHRFYPNRPLIAELVGGPFCGERIKDDPTNPLVAVYRRGVRYLPRNDERDTLLPNGARLRRFYLHKERR